MNVTIKPTKVIGKIDWAPHRLAFISQVLEKIVRQGYVFPNGRGQNTIQINTLARKDAPGSIGGAFILAGRCNAPDASIALDMSEQGPLAASAGTVDPIEQLRVASSYLVRFVGIPAVREGLFTFKKPDGWPGDRVLTSSSLDDQGVAIDQGKWGNPINSYATSVLNMLSSERIPLATVSGGIAGSTLVDTIYPVNKEIGLFRVRFWADGPMGFTTDIAPRAILVGTNNLIELLNYGVRFSLNPTILMNPGDAVSKRLMPNWNVALSFVDMKV